jgi:hypothetical protein
VPSAVVKISAPLKVTYYRLHYKEAARTDFSTTRAEMVHFNFEQLNVKKAELELAIKEAKECNNSF